ncbi:MAG: rRNA maturation RNase YbeY [Selenomonadaceae bacterium]|nr:rRNA maturation RNase YbeY [Selenomonadaceae bacterium]MBQ7492954.1 rRNA maturation RNase YbeY [Selenomonadaceae bacterium]
MNTAISFEPETLTVEENLLAEMLRAADVVGEIYGVENSELSLTLTDDEHIHALNKKYRGVDRATDVLSFAFRESDEPEVVDADFEILGDVIISLERAAAQAQEFGHSFLREVIFLEVHGLLHLLGYDHMDDDERREMEEEQRFIMGKLGILRE